MIARILDAIISELSPTWGIQRQQARKAMQRGYFGAESNRMTNHARPKNQAADSELLGPFGADQLRAWARKLVRDNAYSWGVVDTIVSSVVGCGIHAQSMLETEAGTDIEDTNWARDATWQAWTEVCDVNGQYTFSEIQQICQREIVEAGEVLLHLRTTPGRKYRGIDRPVPLAIELIEADRLATDRDTYTINREGNQRITRGVEMDDLGRPVAYWIYKEHPAAPYAVFDRTPERIDAKNVIHLFRRDRIGQSRGVSWFAPVMSWLRNLGEYVESEMEAARVAACFGVVVKTEGSFPGLSGPDGSESSDDNGNAFEYLEPGIVARLRPTESIESINPGRPNSGAEPWINLILRAIAVGTGLSYEVVARDYSKTNYSSSRTSQLEDRRRFRTWQKYLVTHMCNPIWDRFCESAALAGRPEFPTMVELLENRRKAAPVEWQTPEWEWVDPQSEQQASQASIANFQSTYQAEIGARGGNWRNVFYQRAKEERLKAQLGLVAPEIQQAQANQGQMGPDGTPQPSSEMVGLGRLVYLNNRKAIEDVLGQYAAGTISEEKATVYLSQLGVSSVNAIALLQDAAGLNQPAEEEAQQPDAEVAAT